MSAEKFLCWTDLNNKRYFAPVSKTMVSIPGRAIPSQSNPPATVYLVGEAGSVTVGADVENYSYSDTSPGSIFTVPTFYEALQWVKTGSKSKALYGTE